MTQNGGSLLTGLCACLFILMSAASCVTQPPPATRKPSKPFLISPQIDQSDVTLNLDAPQAREVLVVGQWNNWKSTPLQRNDMGIWTLKVPAMPAGAWSYYFLVDGLEINDPLNPVMQSTRELNASIIQIVSKPPAPWDPQDVPHGVLHIHQYFSTALGRDRQVIVYTPPGYSATSDPLPVLYLAQGFGGNERSWTVEGKANWIADALIAEKKCVPMIIVMSNAHAIPYDGSNVWHYLPPNTAAFIRDLREDVRPLVESNYRVRTDPDSRAFAGLSMGGCEAFTLGLNHSDEFTWVAALSPASVPLDDIRVALNNPAAVNAKLHLFWVPVGCWDSPDELKKFVDKLTAAGLKPEFEIVQGNHSWPVWRADLVKLLPRLFR
jgi:enterochelin esterase family protein